MDGYTEDGVAADPGTGFEAALAAQVGQSSAATQPQAPADPAASTAEEIQRALLDPTTDPRLSDGLEVKDVPAELTPDASEVMHEGHSVREIWDSLGSAASQLEEAQSELGQYRTDEVWGDFEERAGEAYNEDEFAEALADLKQAQAEGRISENDFESALYTAAVEALGGDPTEELDAEDSQTLSEFLSRVDFKSGLLAEQRRIEDLDARIADLIPAAADQRLTEMKAVLTTWARNQGLVGQPEHREARLRAAEEAYRNQTDGRELGDLFASLDTSPDQMLEVLTELDAQVVTGLREYKDRAFQDALLHSGTPDISEGLSYDGRPAIQYELPPPSPDRLNRRVDAFRDRSRMTTKGSVRASFAPDLGMSDGWTKGGRPARQSDVDGSREAYQADEKRRREAARL